MVDLPERQDEYRKSSIHFVNTELDTGLTFARIAVGSTTGSKKERNCVNARRAYDSALHILQQVSLSKDEASAIGEKIAALKSSLEELGEKL
jgi:hypothetical protein